MIILFANAYFYVVNVGKWWVVWRWRDDYRYFRVQVPREKRDLGHARLEFEARRPVGGDECVHSGDLGGEGALHKIKIFFYFFYIHSPLHHRQTMTYYGDGSDPPYTPTWRKQVTLGYGVCAGIPLKPVEYSTTPIGVDVYRGKGCTVSIDAYNTIQTRVSWDVRINQHVITSAIYDTASGKLRHTCKPKIVSSPLKKE